MIYHLEDETLQDTVGDGADQCVSRKYNLQTCCWTAIPKLNVS